MGINLFTTNATLKGSSTKRCIWKGKIQIEHCKNCAITRAPFQYWSHSNIVKVFCVLTTHNVWLLLQMHPWDISVRCLHNGTADNASSIFSDLIRLHLPCYYMHHVQMIIYEHRVRIRSFTVSSTFNESPLVLYFSSYQQPQEGSLQ